MTHEIERFKNMGRLQCFLNGFFLPHTVQAKVLAGEPVLDYVASDTEYMHAIGKEVCGFLDKAVSEYANQNR